MTSWGFVVVVVVVLDLEEAVCMETLVLYALLNYFFNVNHMFQYFFRFACEVAH